MPRTRRTYKKRRFNSRLRDKKLNTLVEKRMNEISKKNIASNEVLYLHNTTHAADQFTWGGFVNLPQRTDYRQIPGGGFEAKVISNMGGNIADTNVLLLTNPDDKQLTIGVKGFQCKFAFVNQSQYNARVQINLIYIPNLNYSTNDAVDFLRPTVFDLWKKGSGNLLYDGWNKKELQNNASSLDSKHSYTILATKTFNINGLPIATGWTYPIRVHKTWLTKTWKSFKKHNVKPTALLSNNQLFTDGNYFFTIHSDLPAGADLRYICATSMKYKAYPSTYPTSGVTGAP